MVRKRYSRFVSVHWKVFRGRGGLSGDRRQLCGPIRELNLCEKVARRVEGEGRGGGRMGWTSRTIGYGVGSKGRSRGSRESVSIRWITGGETSVLMKTRGSGIGVGGCIVEIVGNGVSV